MYLMTGQNNNYGHHIHPNLPPVTFTNTESGWTKSTKWNFASFITTATLKEAFHQCQYTDVSYHHSVQKKYYKFHVWKIFHQYVCAMWPYDILWERLITNFTHGRCFTSINVLCDMTFLWDILITNSPQRGSSNVWKGCFARKICHKCHIWEVCPPCEFNKTSLLFSPTQITCRMFKTGLWSRVVKSESEGILGGVGVSKNVPTPTLAPI
jgi:hypothetical protein